MCQPVSGFVNQDNGYMVYWPGVYSHQGVANYWIERGWCADMDKDRFIPFEFHVATIRLHWDWSPTKVARVTLDAFIGQMDARWLANYMRPNLSGNELLPELLPGAKMLMSRVQEQVLALSIPSGEPLALPEPHMVKLPTDRVIDLRQHTFAGLFDQLWAVPELRHNYWRDR